MLEEMRQFAREAWIPVILDDSLEYVKTLLSSLKPFRILEIGTAIGYSSAIFSEYLEDGGSVDTIEIDKQRIMLARANHKMLKLEDKIHIIEGDALEVLPKLRERYDFIFIDGPKSHYIEYLPYCKRLLSEKGVMLADNVIYKGMVTGPEFVKHKQRTAVMRLREFIDTVQKDEELQSELLDIGDGLLVMRKKQDTMNCVRTEEK